MNTPPLPSSWSVLAPHSVQEAPIPYKKLPLRTRSPQSVQKLCRPYEKQLTMPEHANKPFLPRPSPLPLSCSPSLLLPLLLSLSLLTSSLPLSLAHHDANESANSDSGEPVPWGPKGSTLPMGIIGKSGVRLRFGEVEFEGAEGGVEVEDGMRGLVAWLVANGATGIGEGEQHSVEVS